MICPNCWNDSTKVLESRVIDNGAGIRRRRECENCETRFTTFERIEIINLNITKSNGSLEKYNREKVEESLFIACNKRGIWIGTISWIINTLENMWAWKKEITSKEIGAQILHELKKVDGVAYIRYASVHLKFENVNDFIKFIQGEFL